jgi:hypothetical protein
MKHFLVADLNVRGELQFSERYTYSALEQIPGAIELIARFSGELWRESEHFEITLTPPASSPALRWMASAKTAGIATIRHNALISLSLLATGLDPDADTITLQAFQSHLLRELHDTGIEPAFALMGLTERPLVATINFQSPAQQVDQQLAALADRCFAASYFRFHGLA